MHTSHDPKHAYSIGELLTSADWACAHGDAETVGHIARQLADCVEDGSLHDELIVVADRYIADDEGASESWTELRARLHTLLCEPGYDSTVH